MSKIEPNPYVQQNNDRNLIRQRFPRASDDFISINTNRLPSGADSKSGIRDGVLEKGQVKKTDSRKRKVSITSYRLRLADVDALCGKWHLDALRYFGVIKDDTTKEIVYQIAQKKVDKKTQEKTLIEIIVI